MCEDKFEFKNRRRKPILLAAPILNNKTYSYYAENIFYFLIWIQKLQEYATKYFIFQKKNFFFNINRTEITKEYSKRWVRSNHTLIHIISDTYTLIHTYFNIIERTSAHIERLKYSSYSMCVKINSNSKIRIKYYYNSMFQNGHWSSREFAYGFGQKSIFFSKFKIIHTYIHNWPLQPFSQDYWPSFSHHLCCVC